MWRRLGLVTRFSSLIKASFCITYTPRDAALCQAKGQHASICCMTETRRPGRPATGKTPVKSFRPPTPLWEAAEAKAKAEERTMSDVLISLLHAWVRAPAKAPPGPAERDGP